MIINDFYHRSIASRLGEAVELDNGYLSYLDGAIKIRKLVTDGVRNIVFSDDYEGYITLYIKPGMSLKEILEHHPENTLGSVNKGYLGYRTADFYLFCYEDEFSLYPYSYRSNKTFEEILEKYLDDGDFTSFISNLSTRWMAYDYMEVDLENKNADILYSTRGVHIKIENGDPSKTTFYSNYCFTDYTKHLVKNGILDFEPGVDLVEKTELERRKMID